jgi:hypothetical protein
MKRLLILVVATILLVCSGCAMSGSGGPKPAGSGDQISDADLILRGS